MLEPVALAGMIFSLLVILLIGGFILLYPLSRRLGALLELAGVAAAREQRVRPSATSGAAGATW